MAQVDLQTLEAVARERVEPKVHQYVNMSAIALSMVLEDDGENVAETNLRGVRIAAQFQVNPGFGYGAEFDVLPEAGSPVYKDMRVFFTRLYHGGRFTGDALEQMGKGEDMLIGGLTDRFAQDADAIRKEVNQQLYDSGDNVKATVEGTVTTGANGSFKCALPFGIHRLFKGGKYALVNPSTGAYRVNGGSSPFAMKMVSRVGGSSRMVTFDAVPSDAAAGDLVVYFNSYKKGIHGFPYHVNNGNVEYQGLDKTLNDELKSTVVDGSGGMTWALFDKLEAQLLYIKGGDFDMSGYSYLMSPAQYTNYKRLGDGIRRLVDNVETLDFGVKGVMHNGHKFLVDPDCKDSQIWYLDKRQFRKYQFQPLGLWQVQGRYMQPILTSQTGTTEIGYRDGVQYWHVWKFDVGGWMPNAHALIDSLPVGTSLPSAGNIFSAAAI